MNKVNKRTYLWIFVFLVLAIILAILILYSGFFFFTGKSLTEQAIAQKLKKESETFKHLQFDLQDPELAPQKIRETVLYGYKLITDTQKYAKEFAGDKLNCANCHFAGGITLGGKGGGISLAGVAAKYPYYNKRAGAVIDLPTRINSCFKKSMNGTPLPLDSPEMLAIVTYLHWISKNFPIYQDVPWLGLKKVEIKYKSDPNNGKKYYAQYCAQCHGNDGNGHLSYANGNQNIPPLWGPHSFNDAAGMNIEETLASFIYYNMPYLEPSVLSPEQASDVAAFIISQQRPHLDEKQY